MKQLDENTIIYEPSINAQFFGNLLSHLVIALYSLYENDNMLKNL